MTQVKIDGHNFDMDAVANLMDDELREQLASQKDWASEQEFVDAYRAAHTAKFGEDFKAN